MIRCLFAALLPPLLACSGEPAPSVAPSKQAKAPPSEARPAPQPGTPEPPTAAPLPRDPVSVGPFTVHPQHHGTVRVQAGDRTIWVDPSSRGPLESEHKADLILITDVHGDHFDREGIALVSTEDTRVVAPAAVAEEWDDGTVHHLLANGDRVELGALGITAVPMYNLVRGPEEGALYHEPGRGNGYLLTSAATTLLVAGDTECTPELRALEGVDLALLPMNLPYTMTPEEAADCVRAFRPTVAVPYHYRDSDPRVFQAALEGLEGVTVALRDFYPR